MYSQSFLSNSGARSAGLAYAGVTFSDQDAPINNIAGIADVKSLLISAAASKYYTISGLDIINLNFIYPTEHFTFSISASREGDQLFSTNRLGLGFANKIGFVRIGCQIHYLQYTADELGSKGALALSFGGIANLGKKINFGAYIFNFSQSTLYSEPPEPIPLLMKAGISYSPFSKLKLLIEVEKEIDFEPLRKAGLEYEIIRGIYMRTGIAFDPLKNYFGIGFHKRRFLFDYAFHSHNRLGLSHHLSLSYKITEDE